MSFPPPDATYSEVQAWHVRHSLSSMPRRDWPKCAACEAKTNARPLTARTRIRYSAKFKGRVFEPGQVLCSSHSTETFESSKAAAKILGEMAGEAAHEAAIKGARR